MNNCNCHCATPLDGSSRRGRYLQALDPSYAPIDGRGIEDLLVFAKRYAAQIRYYPLPGDACEAEEPAQQSWREFFRRDLAVIAASIAVMDIAKLKRDYDQNRAHLEAHPDIKALTDLFDPILGIAAKIDRWYMLAIPENPLHRDLQLAIDSMLRGEMKKILAYEEGSRLVFPHTPLKLDVSTLGDDALWGLDANVEPDVAIFDGDTPETQVLNAALYVDDIFHVFYGVIVKLVEERAPGYLQFALETYPGHQPHMALFIAFLELFQLAQQQLNGLTGRMLDFYYQEVLRLTAKPALPDRAYVVFELAKDVAQYDLAQGTVLSAGKDAGGKEQTYATASGLVVNQAKVKELKTVYVQQGQKEVTANGKTKLVTTIKSIYARPVANSQDGFGAPFTDPSGKWPTFGIGEPKNVKTFNICNLIERSKAELYPQAKTRIGFAVASPQLLLQGGKRLISWHIPGLSKLFLNTGQVTDLQIRLSSSQGWLMVNKGFDINKENDHAMIAALEFAYASNIFPPHMDAEAGYFWVKEQELLHVYLPITADAVQAFDSSVHTGRVYPTTQPLMELLLPEQLELTKDDYLRLNSTGQTQSIRVGSIKSNANAALLQMLENRYLDNQNIDNLIKKWLTTLLVPNAGNTQPLFDGLKTFILQNETGRLDSSKPFDPFGPYPMPGKSFYLGSDELANKPLTAIAANIEYAMPSEGDTLGSYSMALLSGRQWLPLPLEDPASFNFAELQNNILQYSEIDKRGNFITTRREPIAAVTELSAQTDKGFLQFINQTQLQQGAYSIILDSQNLAPKLQIKTLSVSYRAELTQFNPVVEQFFHVYPFGVTEVFEYTGSANMRQSLLVQLDKTKAGLLVDGRDLLLPQFNYLDANVFYQAAFDREQKSVYQSRFRSRGTGAPSGVLRDLPLESGGIRQSLHGGNNQYSGDTQEQGLLFIGLEKLRPLDSVSLLFQFADGSAEDEDHDPPAVHWAYLTYNEWRPLPDTNLVADGTEGFRCTGIVKIDVPEDCNDTNTLMPSGLRWFCASVTEKTERFPMLVDVVAQAVAAEFQDHGNDPTHFAAALPPGSISGLTVKANAIAKVTQPFASFDGKLAEQGKEFYARVSERLRHKGRAVTAWDYEHLVLERFPSIYKVKCITHSDPNCLCRESGKADANGDKACCGPQVAPGHVLIVPVADLKNRNAANPLQPKTSRRTLLDIEAYLRQRCSPFVHVHARNPVYEQILVAFRVQFNPGVDKGYHLQKLNDEIVHFLTPWAFDANAEVSFAQKVYASAVVDFIEEREYVDFIDPFFMFVCRDDCCPVDDAPAAAADGNGGSLEKKPTLSELTAAVKDCCGLETAIAQLAKFDDVTVAHPSTPRSLLVSVPKHIILPYPVTQEKTACERHKEAKASELQLGIDDLK